MVILSKSKVIVYTTIGIMSLILVYVMFIQFRIVKENDVEEITFMKEAELKEMLAKYKADYADAEAQYKEVEKKIEEYKQNEKSEEATIVLLEKEIKEANMKLGLTDVVGEGIVIKMEALEGKIIDHSELLTLINELLLAGAEAISINEQRIVAMSDMATVGNFILINGERTISPYTIKAIGDKTHLQSALNIKGGYIDVNKDNYIINIEEGEVQITKYNGKMTLNYAK